MTPRRPPVREARQRPPVGQVVHLVPPEEGEPDYDRLWETAMRIAEQREALVREALEALERALVRDALEAPDRAEVEGACASLERWLGVPGRVTEETA